MRLDEVPVWLWFAPGALLVASSVVRFMRTTARGKAARAAVYDRNVETDPMILMPERVRFRVPRPEEYGGDEER